MTKVLFLFFTTLLAFSNAYPSDLNDSTATIISGTVSSDEDKRLDKVLVRIFGSSGSFDTFTDSDGKFSTKVKPGSYTITVRLPGYDAYEYKNLYINTGDTKELEIYLIEKIVSTDEIQVEGIFKQRQEDLRTSLINIKPQYVKNLPGAVEDVLRTLQSLPGVTSPNDFTSQLIIRGSGPDQNLIVMDDVEVFNPYRLYGLVSMFNPETLNDITLITGGFPAKYGDRLSAVLDVLNREGDRSRSLSTIVNASISNANIIVNGKNPLNIPGSWIVSTRRTYYDLIIGPFAKNAGLITEDSSFPAFRDLQFKLAFGPFEKNKFVVNGIFSQDGVDIVPGEDSEQADSVAVEDVTTNNLLSFAWHYAPNDKFISRTTASWYKNSGDNDFNSEILDPLIDDEGYTPEQRDSLRNIGALLGLEFDSKYTFRKYSLSNKSILLNKNSEQEFGGGVDIVKTDLGYNLKIDEQFRSIIAAFPTASALLDSFKLEGEDNIRAYVYGQSMFKLTDKFFFQPSLRFDYFQIIRTPYLSPRINAGYAFDPITTLRASAGVYYQSPGLEKLIDGRTFYDLRDAAERGLKAERSYHLIFGIDRWITNEWFAKAEAYYKNFDNLLEQERMTAYRYEYTLKDPSITDPAYVKDVKNWIRSPQKLAYDSVTTNPINIGSGDAYGFEIALEKKNLSARSKLSGWINYSFSVSNREKYGVTTPYRFEQTHVANIVLNYRVNNWLELGTRWTYATNFPFTPPVGVTPRIIGDSIATNLLTGEALFNLDFGDDQNQLSTKRPEYHRLDFRATAYTNFWSTDWAFYLDVINVYNRKNVLGYDYSLNSDLTIKRRVVGMFPILPTIGINARF
jgi:hypothetical protein